MNKFQFSVSAFVKTQCSNSILLEDMNISRLMIHANQFEVDKLRIILRITKCLGKETMSILKRYGAVEIARSLNINLQLEHLYQLLFHLPGVHGNKRRASYSKSQECISITITYPTCQKFGKNSLGECFVRKDDCFTFSYTGHLLRDLSFSK